MIDYMKEAAVRERIQGLIQDAEAERLARGRAPEPRHRRPWGRRFSLASARRLMRVSEAF